MAPLVQAPGTKAVPDKYMVVLKEGVSADRLMAHYASVATFRRASRDADPISHVYDMGDAMRGFAGHFSPEDIELIRSHPEVALSLIHISEPTRRLMASRMPSSA